MNRFNVYGFHIFKFHFNLNSFIMVFTNHFSFIYYNSQANINTLIKTADYMMRSKSISRGAEKTASFMICFSVSFYTRVFIIIMVLTFSKTKFTCRHVECVLLGSNLIKQKFKREIISTGFLTRRLF